MTERLSVLVMESPLTVNVALFDGSLVATPVYSKSPLSSVVHYDETACPTILKVSSSSKPVIISLPLLYSKVCTWLLL